MAIAATSYDATDRSRSGRSGHPPPQSDDADLHKALNELTNSMTALEDRYRVAGIAWHRVSLTARERPELSSSTHAGARAARELFEREAGSSTDSRPRDITHRLQDAVADMRREIRAGRRAGVREMLGETRRLHAALEGRLEAAAGAAADGVALGRRFGLVARGRKEEMEEGVRRWIETLPGVRRLAGDDKTVAEHIWYDMYYGTQDGFEEDEEESDSEMTDADLNESDDSDSDS